MAARLKSKVKLRKPHRALRARAEAMLRVTQIDIAGMTKNSVENLVHNLQIHQVELEIQNEELRRAQLELARSRDRYSFLFDFSPIGYVTVNPPGKILEANLTAAQMLGVDRQTLVGAQFSKFIARDAQDAWYLHRQSVLSGENRQTYELQMHKKKGTPLVVRLESVALSDSGDRICHIALIDITERKRAEAALRELAAALELRVEERTTELQNARQQLRALASRLHDLQEEERGRLARELHDEFGAALTALKIDLHWIIARIPKPTAALQQKARAMSELIDGTVNSVRRTAALLRPRILDDFGLVAAIEWQTREFQSRSGIRCVTHLPEELDLGHSVSTALFRILQEALTNVARHARAGEVAVRLLLVGDKVRLDIEDDGRGFNPEAISKDKSFGLFGVQERAYALGGHIRIQRGSPRGTNLMVEIPLDRTAS